MANNEEEKNENCLEGMRCPKCGSLEPFNIECSVLMVVIDNGTDEVHGDVEWGDEDYCQCRECDFEGKVKDFQWTGPTTQEMQEAFLERVPESIEGMQGRLSLLLDLLTLKQLKEACEIVDIDFSEEDEDEDDEDTDYESWDIIELTNFARSRGIDFKPGTDADTLATLLHDADTAEDGEDDDDG